MNYASFLSELIFVIYYGVFTIIRFAKKCNWIQTAQEMVAIFLKSFDRKSSICYILVIILVSFALMAVKAKFQPYEKSFLIQDGVGFNAQNAGKPYSLKIADNGSLRFELRSGDRWSRDDVTTDRGRSEVRQKLVLDYGQDWWARWAFRMTAGLLARDQNIVGQVHAADHLGSRGPIFSVNVDRNGPTLQIRTAEDKATGGGWRYVIRYSEPFELGAQYRFITRMRFGLNGTGQLDFFISKDGLPFKQVVAAREINFGYVGDDAPYFKYGLYMRPYDQLENIVGEYSMRGPSLKSMLPKFLANPSDFQSLRRM